MPYAQAIDMHPVAAIHSPAGLGGYRTKNGFEWMASVRAPSTDTRYVFVVSHGSFCGAAERDLKAGMQAWKLAEATKQWRRHIFNPRSSADVNMLTETVEATLDFVLEFGPESLSLKSIQNSLVQAEHLAALLRASSTWRNKIPGWSEALVAAVAAVKSAGQDPEDVLFGMV